MSKQPQPLTKGDKSHTVLKAVLECGRNFGVGAALMAFAGAAFHQPTIVDARFEIATLGKILLGVGVAWTLLSALQFTRSLDEALKGQRFAWMASLFGFVAVVFIAGGIVITAARWADNNQAIKFCRDSPEAAKYSQCERANPFIDRKR